MQILEEVTEDEMPKLSPEDAQLWKDATKEYNRLKMMQHRAWQTDLSIKLQLKKAALAALPGDCPPVVVDSCSTKRAIAQDSMPVSHHLGWSIIVYAQGSLNCVLSPSAFPCCNHVFLRQQLNGRNGSQYKQLFAKCGRAGGWGFS